MKKRAVLVGTNTYNGLANPLSAPTTEVGFWKDILERNYGFATGNIITLPEKKATHEAVLGAIERQLRGLEPGDIFLFFGAGHGRIVHAHEQFAQYKYEEALMVWPAAGDKTLISAELTDSDLTEVFRRAAPPLGSKIAVMIDACFSGRLNIPLPPDAKPLTLPPVEDFSRASGALVRPFASITGSIDTSVERPIVVAACGPDETATEVTYGGQRRLLFSARAIDWLETHASGNVTFYGLVHDIRPLRDKIKQTPITRGNTTRDRELFPGYAAPPAAQVVTPSRVPARPGIMRAGALTTAETTPGIEIRTKGICCFADARRESDPIRKRLLLPYDDRYDPDLRHYAFLEIDSDDVLKWQGEPIIGPHPTNPLVSYHRWWLQGYSVSVSNRVRNWPFEVTDAYRVHVPGMKEAVEPNVDYNPDPSCFDEFPDPRRVSAFLDIDSGSLTAGPLEMKKVQFVRSDGTPATEWEERTPEWCVLYVPTTEPVTVVDLIPFDGGDPIQISIRAGGSMLIGNERLTDIIEEHTPQEEPAENFMLFYYLGKRIPDDPALPKVDQVPINACTNTNWP